MFILCQLKIGEKESILYTEKGPLYAELILMTK